METFGLEIIGLPENAPANNLNELYKAVDAKALMEVFLFADKDQESIEGKKVRLWIILYQFIYNTNISVLESYLQKEGYTFKRLTDDEMEDQFANKNLFLGGCVPHKKESVEMPQDCFNLIFPILMNTNGLTVSMLLTPHGCVGLFSGKKTDVGSVVRALDLTYLSKPLYVADFLEKKRMILNWLVNLKRLQQCFTPSSYEHVCLPYGKGMWMRNTVACVQNLFIDEAYLNNPEKGLNLGRIGSNDFTLPLSDIDKHTLVVGTTGSGKSHVLARMILELKKKGMHVIVIDSVSRQFRNLYSLINTTVYSQGRSNSLPLNFFQVSEFTTDQQLENAKNIMNAGIEDDALAIQEFLREALESYFNKPGHKNADDFMKHAMDSYNQSAKYGHESGSNMRGALDVRLRKYASVFSSADSFSMDLILKDAIVECDSYGSDEERAMVVYFILAMLFAYKKAKFSQGEVKYSVVVLDECHGLLDPSQNAFTAKKLQALIMRIITEGRKYGLWLIMADQRLDVVKKIYEQVGTKVILKSHYDDVLDQIYSDYKKVLPRLSKGEGVIHAPGMQDPAMIKFAPVKQLDIPLTDEGLKDLLLQKNKVQATLIFRMAKEKGMDNVCRYVIWRKDLTEDAKKQMIAEIRKLFLL